jgi:Phage integrase, N-terminal SAM-like domain
MEELITAPNPVLIPAKDRDGHFHLPALPPLLAGSTPGQVNERLEKFFLSVADIFESWVARRSSAHTQRANRQDVMAFIRFIQIPWPEGATALFHISVRDVHACRDQLIAPGAAPKTINRRIASLSSFFKYLQAAAAELRFPITVPNRAHAQFLGRDAADPREETRALSATRARQSMGLHHHPRPSSHRTRSPTIDFQSALLPKEG